MSIVIVNYLLGIFSASWLFLPWLGLVGLIFVVRSISVLVVVALFERCHASRLAFFDLLNSPSGLLLRLLVFALFDALARGHARAQAAMIAMERLQAEMEQDSLQQQRVFAGMVAHGVRAVLLVTFHLRGSLRTFRCAAAFREVGGLGAFSSFLALY